MSLRRLLDKKSLVLLGLNSGTSADGIDLAVVRFSRRSGRIRWTFVEGTTRKYPERLRAALLETADADTIALNYFLYLDNILGDFLGRSADMFVRQMAKEGVIVNAIASHGQTVRHLPVVTAYLGKRTNATSQIGSLAHIAALTGLPTIGDFRQADIAIGGEGAPITTGAMSLLFGSTKESRLIVNIGGMSNYFYLGSAKQNEVAAADCGPGNALCDIVSQKLYKENFDRGGRHASKGTPSERLLTILLAEPFFQRGERSTGREAFGPSLVKRMVQFAREFSLSDDDLMATAVELTTRAIAMAVWPILCKDERLTKLYLTGGGRKNTFMAARLGHHLPDVSIHSIELLGIDGDLVEAACYALLGEMALRGEGSPDGAITRSGRTAVPVRGQIVQPPVTRYDKR